MSNPFERDDVTYIVLVNQEKQHSLWPMFLNIPDGWQQVGSEKSRAECLEWIDKNWTDLRPASLVCQMESDQDSKSRKKDD